MKPSARWNERARRIVREIAHIHLVARRAANPCSRGDHGGLSPATTCGQAPSPCAPRVRGRNLRTYRPGVRLGVDYGKRDDFMVVRSALRGERKCHIAQ
jgi:hypothetical protein